MNKRLLLINPWIYDFSAYDFWLKPVGLLYIASFMRAHGYEVFFLDLLNRFSTELMKFLDEKGKNKIKSRYYGMGKFPSEEVEKPEFLKAIPRRFKRYGFPKELVLRILKNLSFEKWDAVLVTSTITYWYFGVWDTISLIKEFIESPVILGGLYPFFFPNHAKNSGADFIISYTSMKQVSFELSKILKFEVKQNLVKGWFDELYLDYSLYEDSNLEYAVVLTSLGCPFRCSYCATPVIYDGKFIVKDVDMVLKDIEDILNRGIKNIVFFDDAFLIPPQRAKDILKGIIDRGYNEAFFHLPNGIHVKLIDEEMAYLLKMANFKTIILGVETLDPALWRRIGNKFNRDELDRAICLLKSVGLSNEIRLYLMVNMIGQDFESAKMYLNECMKYGVRIHLNEYTPIPKTKDWEYLIKTGKIDSNIDPLLLNNTILPYWWKYGMSVEEIEELKKMVNEHNHNL